MDEGFYEACGMVQQHFVGNNGDKTGAVEC
jgi:hypothetical protein